MIRRIKNYLKKTFIYTIYVFFKTKPRKLRAEIDRFYLNRIKYPQTYKKYAKLPVDENKIIFVEPRFPAVSNSFKVIYDELVNNYNYTVHTHFLRNPFVKGRPYVQRCLELLKDMATAKYVFISDASNVTSCFKMRPETIFTQLWHGCGAFKKFGMSTADLIFGLSRKMQEKYPNYGNYTHVTVSSPEVIWAYEEAMNYQDRPGVVKPVGISRTDIFYDKDFIASAYEKLHLVMPQSKGKKVILYAPTFRGRIANAQTPEELNIKFFQRELGDEYVLLFKHHPFVKKPPVIAETYKDFAQDVTDSMSIEELLCVSDICISDYSSLVFEYSLFERPLIFFAFDLDEYFDWRGFYYDYYELAPGPIVKTNLEMIDYIKNIDTRFDKKRVHEFREKFMSACDGHATERIMQMVFGDTLDTHRKPESERTNFPANTIPSSEKFFSTEEEELESLKRFKQEARATYAEHSSLPIEANKACVVIGDKRTPADMIAQKLEDNGSFKVCRITDNDLFGAAELATARFIVLYGASKLVNVLEIRNGTEIVELPETVFPVERADYASIKYKLGYLDDRLKIAPLHGKYDIVPVASDFASSAYKEIFNLSDDSVFKRIGSVSIDAYFDKEYISQARAKIDEAFPSAKGKKIIFYKPTERIDKVKRPAAAAFVDINTLYEYLQKDYVLLFNYASEKKNKLSVPKCSSLFACNMMKFGISDSELMAVADVVIGDYNFTAFEAIAKEKPVFFYTPDLVMQTGLGDAFINYNEITDGLRFDDSEELALKIADLKSYDYGRLKELKKTYFDYCDGNTANKLIEVMKAEIK